MLNTRPQLEKRPPCELAANKINKFGYCIPGCKTKESMKTKHAEMKAQFYMAAY